MINGYLFRCSLVMTNEGGLLPELTELITNEWNWLDD
jgi:hypothetical protein